ncbi:tRNA (adenosine(37)-N6)-threonylcarbamoyltransferase complex ATPase subunit type 1 TsaE [Shewanella sp. D64]|uniref:tRNA (adenosine(37)-N6)-threonylcarbamoyltransferase complex ATPase subunit type 1 TsaE n=1 Tax=unclassified Shewanella TaxID=196818 RepID=UPI0022BA23FD|nr:MULTISPECIES: tRNA (adenosine(37)-N6)-threonylcarbamoyltransferase complex ATPase subunit type 1 TsaE [unclassified Shewanella]MEC4724664.1 tRNA (adenosine(37)-N6)-threonylcarbamoyltransferase complex ATPase subunit type 1 TsaE [Shewanella sp. D64]MEC4736559.1 tRNA (adenosine(37)-N6)-threonylcarbamoyltransferase complex ATPase subunit type 1 TsaE [Shewanella sp. E94]WBJ94764.1 tRNA (adenosine(37)-N6)-threonylcarbamoyltransferase complex ATPase subunit type 1 TsaE [Shewanella sp. MTB7]
MASIKVYLDNELDTVELGQRLAAIITPPLILNLSGELGAGKTTLSRGLIQALGHKGAVKSPTYALVEPYELAGVDLYHFDLYRLSDPEELEYMGIRDYFTETSICVVEWPDRGYGLIPDADISCHIKYVDTGREVEIVSGSEKGQLLLSKFK